MGLGGPGDTPPHPKHATSIMPNIEKIYDDFLYDCHIANQHLTPEDWAYYGKEEHHIEIPNRDGGALTPCNSQYLTTYQHWVAGVLQSEVLQKCCSAYVPKEVLPAMVEMLRVKWPGNPRVVPEKYAHNMPYRERKVNPRSIRISKMRGKSVIVTTPTGQVLQYDSIKLACRTYGLHPGHIREVCQGKRNHHKRFTARYAEL